MSKPELPPNPTEEGLEDAPRSLNLWIVYGLMFVAFLVAIGVAMLIVLPFYQHRR
jgi:hypothetical protein